MKFTSRVEVITELSFVKEIRNNLSHRSSLNKVEDDKILEEAKKLEIDLEKLSSGLYIEDPSLTRLSKDFNAEKSRIFYKAKSVIKRKNEDYNIIIRNLDILKDCVIFDIKIK